MRGLGLPLFALWLRGECLGEGLPAALGPPPGLLHPAELWNSLSSWALGKEPLARSPPVTDGNFKRELGRDWGVSPALVPRGFGARWRTSLFPVHPGPLRRLPTPTWALQPGREGRTGGQWPEAGVQAVGHPPGDPPLAWGKPKYSAGPSAHRCAWSSLGWGPVVSQPHAGGDHFSARQGLFLQEVCKIMVLETLALTL